MFGNSLSMMIVIPLILLISISLIIYLIWGFIFTLDLLSQHHALIQGKVYNRISVPVWQYKAKASILKPSKLLLVIDDVYYYLTLYKDKFYETGNN